MPVTLTAHCAETKIQEGCAAGLRHLQDGEHNTPLQHVINHITSQVLQATKLPCDVSVSAATHASGQDHADDQDSDQHTLL
jgi:hypothetical protein